MQPVNFLRPNIGGFGTEQPAGPTPAQPRNPFMPGGGGVGSPTMPIGPARPVFPGTGGWAGQAPIANPGQHLPFQGRPSPTFGSNPPMNRMGNLMSFSQLPAFLASLRSR